jgi:biotin carboxylase
MTLIKLPSLLNPFFSIPFLGRFCVVLFCAHFLSFSLGASSCRQNLVVIVDAYSSGKDLVPAFHEAGWQVAHVHSDIQERILPVFWEDFEASHFRHLLVDSQMIDRRQSQSSIKNLVQSWNGLPIRAVVAGAETGVTLADELAEIWKTPNANGTLLSQARVDKYLMHMTLKAAGIRYIDQIKSKDLKEILEWAATRDQWPVVIKPPSSAGTVGVTFARSAQEIEMAFAKIYGQQNGLHRFNEEVIVQEYIPGEEFAFDTVSLAGQVKISEILYYERPVVEGAATVYRANHLLSSPRSTEVTEAFDQTLFQEKLYLYASSVLNALGILNGAAHMEIKVTPEGEVVLIEVGARICGAQTPRMIRAAADTCQVGLAVESIVDPRAFSKRPTFPSIRRSAIHFFGHTRHPGYTLNHQRLEELENIPGVIGIFPHFDERTPLRRSIDADTIPFDIQIVHDDPEEVTRTRQRIEAMEEAGFFETPRIAP